MYIWNIVTYTTGSGGAVAVTEGEAGGNTLSETQGYTCITRVTTGVVNDS